MKTYFFGPRFSIFDSMIVTTFVALTSLGHPVAGVALAMAGVLAAGCFTEQIDPASHYDEDACHSIHAALVCAISKAESPAEREALTRAAELFRCDV